VKGFERHEWQRSGRRPLRVDTTPSPPDPPPMLVVSSVCTAAEPEAQITNSVVYYNLDLGSICLQGHTELFKMAANAGDTNPKRI
jgi:hypothetical protein